MNPHPLIPASGRKKQPDNYEKGRAFEKYVIDLFNKDRFHLKEWRESKKRDGSLYSADLCDPDLELELVFTGSRTYRFAVECKWRKEFRDGWIEWATVPQIHSYELFQSQKRIPVFIAIGVGGDPWSPEKLFVTPLNNISNDTDVNESQLIPYKRRPTRRFFYDIRQLKLF